MFHPRFRLFLRAAAVATLVAYLPTNIDVAYAAPALQTAEILAPADWNLDQSLAFALPTEFARVESVHPGHKGTILHVQTAHGHYEAQQKTEKLLDWLQAKYGNYPVFLEGAAGKLEPKRLEFFPNRLDLNLQNARWLAKKSLVTGPEIYLLKNKSQHGFGIENSEAYQKNHAQFARVLKAREEAQSFSEVFTRAMEKGATAFSPDLRAFLKRLEQHQLEIIAFDAWLAELQKNALEHLKLDLKDAAWQVRWPMLTRFFKAQDFAKQFDASHYETEKNRFLTETKPYLSRDKKFFTRIESLLNSVGQSIQLPEPETENAFVEMLRRLPREFDFKNYPQVARLIGILVLQSEINPAALNAEVRRLEELLTEKLAQSENEKALLQVFADYRLLEKLLALQLTPADFAKMNSAKIKPSAIASRVPGDLAWPSFNKLDLVFDEAVAFYQGARERDQVMVRRAENHLNQNPAKFAVMITGGFHTAAMREHFEKAGYSYAVVTPAISGADEDGHRAYLKAMTANFSKASTPANSTIELAQAIDPVLGGTTRTAALQATVGRVRAEKELSGLIGRSESRGNREEGRRLSGMMTRNPIDALFEGPATREIRRELETGRLGVARDLARRLPLGVVEQSGMFFKQAVEHLKRSESRADEMVEREFKAAWTNLGQIGPESPAYAGALQKLLEVSGLHPIGATGEFDLREGGLVYFEDGLGAEGMKHRVAFYRGTADFREAKNGLNAGAHYRFQNLQLVGNQPAGSYHFIPKQDLFALVADKKAFLLTPLRSELRTVREVLTGNPFLNQEDMLSRLRALQAEESSPLDQRIRIHTEDLLQIQEIAAALADPQYAELSVIATDADAHFLDWKNLEDVIRKLEAANEEFFSADLRGRLKDQKPEKTIVNPNPSHDPKSNFKVYIYSNPTENGLNEGQYFVVRKGNAKQFAMIQYGEEVPVLLTPGMAGNSEPIRRLIVSSWTKPLAGASANSRSLPGVVRAATQPSSAFLLKKRSESRKSGVSQSPWLAGSLVLAGILDAGIVVVTAIMIIQGKVPFGESVLTAGATAVFVTGFVAVIGFIIYRDDQEELDRLYAPRAPSLPAVLSEEDAPVDTARSASTERSRSEVRETHELQKDYQVVFGSGLFRVRVDALSSAEGAQFALLPRAQKSLVLNGSPVAGETSFVVGWWDSAVIQAGSRKVTLTLKKGVAPDTLNLEILAEPDLEAIVLDSGYARKAGVAPVKSLFRAEDEENKLIRESAEDDPVARSESRVKIGRLAMSGVNGLQDLMITALLALLNKYGPMRKSYRYAWRPGFGRILIRKPESSARSEAREGEIASLGFNYRLTGDEMRQEDITRAALRGRSSYRPEYFSASWTYDIAFVLSSGTPGDFQNGQVILDFYVRPVEQEGLDRQNFYKGFVTVHFKDGKLASWDNFNLNTTRREMYPWLERVIFAHLNALRGTTIRSEARDVAIKKVLEQSPVVQTRLQELTRQAKVSDAAAEELRDFNENPFKAVWENMELARQQINLQVPAKTLLPVAVFAQGSVEAEVRREGLAYDALAKVQAWETVLDEMTAVLREGTRVQDRAGFDGARSEVRAWEFVQDVLSLQPDALSHLAGGAFVVAGLFFVGYLIVITVKEIFGAKVAKKFNAINEAALLKNPRLVNKRLLRQMAYWTRDKEFVIWDARRGGGDYYPTAPAKEAYAALEKILNHAFKNADRELYEKVVFSLKWRSWDAGAREAIEDFKSLFAFHLEGRIREVQGYKVYRVGDEKNYFEVSSFGANVFSLVSGGRQLLWHKSNGEKFREENGLAVSGGMPFMFPWTSRIENGKIRVDGKEIDLSRFQFLRKVPDAQAGPHILHGVTDKVEWDVAAGRGDSLLKLSKRLRDIPTGDAEYPTYASVFGDVTVNLTYTIDGGQFKAAVEILGDRFTGSLGWHPFFKLGESLEGWQAQIPAAQYWKTDPLQVPLKSSAASVEGSEFDFREGLDLNRAFEIGLTGLQAGDFGTAVSSLRHSGTGEELKISQDSRALTNVMFWVPFGNPNLPAGIASIQANSSSANAINQAAAGFASGVVRKETFGRFWTSWTLQLIPAARSEASSLTRSEARSEQARRFVEPQEVSGLASSSYQISEEGGRLRVKRDGVAFLEFDISSEFRQKEAAHDLVIFLNQLHALAGSASEGEFYSTANQIGFNGNGFSLATPAEITDTARLQDWVNRLTSRSEMRKWAHTKLKRLRLGAGVLAAAGALAGMPQKAEAVEDLILPSATNTLNDVSRVTGIQKSSIVVGGGGLGTFVMNSDRQMTLTANNLTVSGREVEANVSFDDPNTPAVESVNISALSTNGFFTVGLRDSNATNGAGTVTLFVDDAAGNFDFVLLDGVDNTTRIWNVPISLFDGVNSNQIKSIAFVLFSGFMPNSPAVLNIHFRGHPYIPLLSGSSLISLSSLNSLDGVLAGITTVYRPVAVSEFVAGGAVTSLVSSATNFVMGYSIPNSNSLVRVQIDRGTLDPVDLFDVGLDAGEPKFSFMPLTGNLYGMEFSTNLIQWTSGIPTIAATGVVTIANYGTGAENGFARILTKQFPFYNSSNSFAFGMRGSPANNRVLVELVDFNGISAPFWVSTLSSTFRYAITNNPALLPEGFNMGAIDKIRVSVPKSYEEYPAGTNKVNALPNATIEFRLQNGIGPVGPDRSEMRDVRELNFESYPWRSEETAESLIRIFLNKAGILEKEHAQYRLFKVETEGMAEIPEEYRGKRLEFDSLGIEEVGKFLVGLFGSNRSDRFKKVWVGIEEPVTVPDQPGKKSQVQSGVLAAGKKKIVLKTRDRSVDLAQKEAARNIAARIAPTAAPVVPSMDEEKKSAGGPRIIRVSKGMSKGNASLGTLVREASSKPAAVKPKSKTWLVWTITFGSAIAIAAGIYFVNRSKAAHPSKPLPAKEQPVNGARSEARWVNPDAQKVLVVGTGFVGATKAILQAVDFGHDVVALDVVKAKLDKLRAGELPFEAEYLPELLRQAIDSGRLAFTDDYASALEGRKFIYLALPTPQSEKGEADTRYLESAVRTIAQNLNPGEEKILIGKSTAPPKWTVQTLRRVADEVLAARRAKAEDLRGAQIHFAWEPEFLREAKEVEDDRGVAGRLVIGAETPEIAEQVKRLYLNWDPNLNPPRREVPIILTDIVSAPLVKYAANGYRGLKISFINFISWLTEELGLDVNDVADSIGLDSRVIRNFLTAGPGFGGSCFPKDLAAFVKITKELGVSSGIILDALAVNRVQIDRFIKKMEDSLSGFKDKKVVLLGGAFKAGTSDTRESRAVIVAKKLVEAGARVVIVDPAAKEELEWVFREYNQGANKPVTFYESVNGNYEAVFGDAASIAVMTEWPEFKKIDFNQILALYHHGQKLPSFFDGRNLFERAGMERLGFEYFDIGRGKKPSQLSEEDYQRLKSEFSDWVREFFLVLRISYINMIAEVAEKLGANILDVQKGFGYDPVVFGYKREINGEIDYLDPGIGWGGHDLMDSLRQMEELAGRKAPKLLDAFDAARAKYLKRFGIPDNTEDGKVPFVDVSRDINHHQIGMHVEKIKQILGVKSLEGKTISVLGVAYKQGTHSIEGSPSVELIEELLKGGAVVHIWDPEAAATASVKDFLHEQGAQGEVKSFVGPHDAMRGTDLQVVVHVDNGYEKNIAHLVMDGAGNRVANKILDARHVFNNPQAFRNLGVEYHAIGVPLPPARSEARTLSKETGIDASLLTSGVARARSVKASFQGARHTGYRLAKLAVRSPALAAGVALVDWDALLSGGKVSSLMRSELRAQTEEEQIIVSEGLFDAWEKKNSGVIALENGQKMISTDPQGLLLAIKPPTGKITRKTIFEIIRGAHARGWRVNAARVMSSQDIRRQQIMPKHYARHHAVAMYGQGALNESEISAVEQSRLQMNAAGQSFEKIYSAFGLIEQAGISPRELADLWKESYARGGVQKLGQGDRGFFAGSVAIPDRDGIEAEFRGKKVLVFNGFYPAVEKNFTDSDYPTVVIWLKPYDGARNPFTPEEMKEHFAGATDPSKAAEKNPDSLRARAYRHDFSLELDSAASFDVERNFIHLTDPKEIPNWQIGDGEFYAWFGDMITADFIPAHIRSIIRDLERIETSNWPLQLRDLKIALHQNRLHDAAKEAAALKPYIRPENPLIEDVHTRIVALRSESRGGWQQVSYKTPYPRLVAAASVMTGVLGAAFIVLGLRFGFAEAWMAPAGFSLAFAGSLGLAGVIVYKTKFQSRSESRLEEAIDEIQGWKNENQGRWDEYLPESPFETRLESKVKNIYSEKKLYEMKFEERRLFIEAVFGARNYRGVLSGVRSLVGQLDGKTVEKLDAGKLLSSEDYKRFGGLLARLEHLHPILEAHYIRFAAYLLFDFWDHETRVLEIAGLLDGVEVELGNPGVGEFPLTAAMQDLHGGTRRALALIGFVMGLPADVYNKLSTVEDLEHELKLIGKSLDDFPGRIIGLNDKYDRGNDPVGSAKLVQRLTATGKARPIVGNHDLWRAEGALGIHLLFRAIAKQEGRPADYYERDGAQKTHHPASWAEDAFPHEGWGVVELEQINQRRFNQALASVNRVLALNGVDPLPALDLAVVRAAESETLNKLKKEISKKRKDMIAGNLSKEAFAAFQKENPLPDVHSKVMEELRGALSAANQKITRVNEAAELDIPSVEFQEVNLDNYFRDPEIIERTLWELKNFRLFYVDILGNLHMHNIIPIDYRRGGFDVQYKGKRGLAAMELIARDIRLFFENVETIPDSQAFRKKMWEQVGEAITIVNGWYSDLDPQAKVPAIKKFVDEGKMEGLLGHAEDVPVDREVSGIFFWGHNERSKLLSPGGDMPALPYAFLYPDLGTALFNIDGEMSEGYSDRGMIVTLGMKINGKVTGLRVWGYKKGSNVIEDLTFEDIPGMPEEQLAMLKYLHDDRGFLEWNRARLLKEMIKHLNILILSAERDKRSDENGSKLDHYRQLRMRMQSFIDQDNVSKAFTRRSEMRTDKTDPIWLGLDSPTADWQRMNAAIWVYLDLKNQDGGNGSEDVIKRKVSEKLAQMGLGVNDADLSRIWESVKATAVLEDPVKAGINSDNGFYFKEKLERLLVPSARRTGMLAIFELFEAYEKAAEEWPLYALESRWPMLRAVAMMEKENQKALLKILAENPKKFGRFRLTDTIFLMLGEELLTEKEYEAYVGKWMKAHAPNLVGRDIYYVSPETWLLAGGLGRVGQYHTRGVRKLLAKQGRLLTIEPLYHYRIRPDGSQHPLDYSKLETPVLDLEDSYEFSVTVKGQPVSVTVKKGRTEDGIPVYLLDGGDFYTRALYKYGSQYGSADWKAFTEFFSRASLELITRIETEKQAEQGEAYKAPVIWGNDGQSGLLPVYKRMLDKSHRVLRKAFVWFTTHTFANRGYFGWDDSFARDAGVGHSPYEDLLKNRKDNAWDATSGGVKGADGVNGVAAAHRHEVSRKDPDAVEVSISNGDDLNKSAAYFREVLLSLYPQADVWRPTGEQILKTKSEVIRRLNPKFKEKYGVELNPDALVISYSGRFVPEKSGRTRAFTSHNLRELVLGGANIAYFGNTQVEPDHNFAELRRLAQTINAEADRLERETGRKLGRMIVATGWSLHDQVEVLAMTHIQVQDSHYKTGASEVTEANFSVNGGLNMGPAWTEGNIQKIGIVLDPAVPGSGNILIPKDDAPSSYLGRLLSQIKLFHEQPEHFGSYLETSVRLSRVVNAILPASEYLLQFEAGVRQKEALSALSSKIKKGVLRSYSSGAFKNTALARELEVISKMSYAEAAALYGERALPSVAVAVAFLLPETLSGFKNWNFPGYGMLENYVAAPEHEVLFRDDAVLRVHQTDHYGVIMFSRASPESNRVLTPAVRLESVAWDQQSRKTWAAGIENIERIVDSSNRAIYRIGDYSVAGKILHIYPKRPTGEEISKSHRLGVPTMPHDSPDANVRHELAGAQLLFLEKEAPARSESRKGQDEVLGELQALIDSRKLNERDRAEAVRIGEKLGRPGWTLRALKDAEKFVSEHSKRSESREQNASLLLNRSVEGTFEGDGELKIWIDDINYYKVWTTDDSNFGKIPGVQPKDFWMQRFQKNKVDPVGGLLALVEARPNTIRPKDPVTKQPLPSPFSLMMNWQEGKAHFVLVGLREKKIEAEWIGSLIARAEPKRVSSAAIPGTEESDSSTEDSNGPAAMVAPLGLTQSEVIKTRKSKKDYFDGRLKIIFGTYQIKVWRQESDQGAFARGQYYFRLWNGAQAVSRPAILPQGLAIAFFFGQSGAPSFAAASKIEKGKPIAFTFEISEKTGAPIFTAINRDVIEELRLEWLKPEARQQVRSESRRSLVEETVYLTLEEARAKLAVLLGGIVSPRWVQAATFEDIARVIRQISGIPVVFAGEVPEAVPSFLSTHQPNAVWQFDRAKMKPASSMAAQKGQVILHPRIMDLILSNGRAAFELLKQFEGDLNDDVAPLVAFSEAGSDLRSRILQVMTNARSGLTPTEKAEAAQLVKLLQIENLGLASAENAMNQYLAEYQSWKIAVLLPSAAVLDQVQGGLKMALAENSVADEDVVAFAKIASALHQAANLAGDDQIRYLNEKLKAAKSAHGWTVSLKAVIDTLVLTHELITTSA